MQMMNTACWACLLVLGSDPQPLRIEAALLTAADQAEVPAREAGLISEIAVREGHMVRAGELIARLEDADARLAVAKATLELERARKLAESDIKIRTAQGELEYAKAEFLRALQSEEKLPGSVTAAERERLQLLGRRAALDLAQAELDRETARLAVPLFENELRTAEEKLARRRVTAPISGTVVSVAKRLGEWAEPGQTVVRVLATEKLRVEFFLAADQATTRIAGSTVHFLLSGVSTGSEPFVGRVAFVSPEVDPLNGQVRVWAEIDNHEGQLRPGLAGELVIAP
jgi:macrolide-specific efflux system membrane fusion protein